MRRHLPLLPRPLTARPLTARPGPAFSSSMAPPTFSGLTTPSVTSRARAESRPTPCSAFCRCCANSCATSSPNTSASLSTCRPIPTARISSKPTRPTVGPCRTTSSRSSRGSARWSKRSASPSSRCPNTRPTTCSAASQKRPPRLASTWCWSVPIRISCSWSAITSSSTTPAATAFTTPPEWRRTSAYRRRRSSTCSPSWATPPTTCPVCRASAKRAPAS